MERRVLVEMNDTSLKNIIGKLDEHSSSLVVQFTAKWCKPCKSIKELCNSEYAKLPKEVIIAVIDIDDNIDLYLFMKRKRMLTGVPTVMAWMRSNCDDDWFVADSSVTGTDERELRELFKAVGRNIDPNYGQEEQAKICIVNKDE